jgi:hypothetical protein
MACFTDAPYANWSYQLLLTLSNSIAPLDPPLVSIGCYSQMNQSEQLYQFYRVLSLISNDTDFLYQNCFVQLTDAQQWDALNDAVAAVFAPPPIT